MRSCGYIIILLGILTNILSNVDGSSFLKSDTVNSKDNLNKYDDEVVDCATLRKDLETCAGDPASPDYCDTDKDKHSCFIKASGASSTSCKGDDMDKAVSTIKQKCHDLTCDTFRKDLEKCAGDAASADYCDTGKDTCHKNAIGVYPWLCRGSEIDTAVKNIREKCQVFACDTIKNGLEECVNNISVNEDYCKPGKDAPSCLDKANEAPPKYCTGDDIATAAAAIVKKCEGDKTSTTLSPIEHCKDYLESMFQCWDHETIFPSSCKDEKKRFKLLDCANKAKARYEDGCDEVIFKQYNSNLMKFATATDKYFCQGDEPIRFNEKCTKATLSKEIILASFVGDMNECGPLVKTIEMFEALLGTEDCTKLLDDYIVAIKKLDYCQPKTAPTSSEEPKDKDGGSANLSGNVRLLGVLSIVLTVLFAVY